MRIHHLILAALFILISTVSLAQQAKLTGLVKDAYTNEPVPFVNVVVFNTQNGTTTAEDGRFSFENLAPGYVQLQLSFIGYETLISEEIQISAIRPNYLELTLKPTTTSLQEVRVVSSPFAQKAENPVSLHRIGVDLIEKSAGASRDFSKVLQSFPGVGSVVSFRNDLIVRGGGPSENRFFLDGIEIPTLNHFSTQGASGGPVGILNVDFIREVDFYSGAFPASRGNALSSVFEFRQIDANQEKSSFRTTVGASEISLSLNTPISKKTTALFSVRRSYLQFLFDKIGLPFLPTFNDFQFSTKTRIDQKNEISFIGVGALDQFKLNPSPKPTEENRYILDYLPAYEQWNYTIGASYKHFLVSSYYVLALSRSHLNNAISKYAGNDESSIDNQLYDYNSDETENKFRLDYFSNPGDFTINTGVNLEYAGYYNRTVNRVFVNNLPSVIDYRSKLDIFKWGAFGSVSHAFFNNDLVLSAGGRLDANNYSSQMSNPLKQLSPRASVSYRVHPSVSFNASVGRYFQLPAYTTLGYRNSDDVLKNKTNGIKYIRADHFIAGIDWRVNSYTKIGLEGFRKNYADYPLSIRDGVSLASKGAGYGVFGDEEVTPVSEGSASGFEVLIQQRSPKGFSYIMAYTWVVSEFTDASGKLVPSSWDSGHLLTLTFNKTFKRNWDAGLKWRYVGALPYTPYDKETSSLVEAWDLKGQGYLDFSRFNQQRLGEFHQLDIRVDKTFYFRKFSLGFYLDIQNAYSFQYKQPANLVQVLDDGGNPKTDESGENYLLKELKNTSGTLLPSIGLILEF
jgi:hypothetical protein